MGLLSLLSWILFIAGSCFQWKTCTKGQTDKYSITSYKTQGSSEWVKSQIFGLMSWFRPVVLTPLSIMQVPYRPCQIKCWGFICFVIMIIIILFIFVFFSYYVVTFMCQIVKNQVTSIECKMIITWFNWTGVGWVHSQVFVLIYLRHDNCSLKNMHCWDLLRISPYFFIQTYLFPTSQFHISCFLCLIYIVISISIFANAFCLIMSVT